MSAPPPIDVNPNRTFHYLTQQEKYSRSLGHHTHSQCSWLPSSIQYLCGCLPLTREQSTDQYVPPTTHSTNDSPLHIHSNDDETPRESDLSHSLSSSTLSSFSGTASLHSVHLSTSQPSHSVADHSHPSTNQPHPSEESTATRPGVSFTRFKYKLFLVPIIFFTLRLWGSIRVILIFFDPDYDQTSASGVLGALQSFCDPAQVRRCSSPPRWHPPSPLSVQGFFNGLLFMVCGDGGWCCGNGDRGESEDSTGPKIRHDSHDRLSQGGKPLLLEEDEE